MKLTKSVIDRAKYEGDGVGRFVLWDSSLSGFGLRIYPSGRKAFILSYRFQGRKRLLTLGDFGELTLDQARDRALRANLSAKDGEDPLADRRREVAGETVGDLCDSYLERHAKIHKKSWKEDERRLDRFIRPAWKAHKVRSISAEDVAHLHLRIGKQAPYEANRVLEIISKMFELARRWRMFDEGAPNPARDIDKFPEKKRDRWLTSEELPRLAKAIGDEQSVYVRAAIWLYLFTGVRKSELLNAKWEDVDLQRRELRLPDTKSGRTHYVPLSEPALDLLRAIPRECENPYVLPGHVKGKALVNISKPWYRIRKAAKVEDARLHDLRRTVGSMMAQGGQSLQTIGKVLNHSSLAITQGVYAHLSDTQARAALDAHGRVISDIAKGNVSAP
ncbi:site-specific integrase [Bdellovibrionota bacterium FG-2]